MIWLDANLLQRINLNPLALQCHETKCRNEGYIQISTLIIRLDAKSLQNTSKNLSKPFGTQMASI
jgi:hypothetical protein